MSDSKAKTPRRFLGPMLRIATVLLLLGVIFKTTGCMEHMFYIPTRGQTPTSQGPVGTIDVWFESSDGTRLYGWLIPANGDAANMRDAATILHVHGNAGNILSHHWFTEHLPPAGFNVFIFDFRGYGQSEGAAKRRGPLIADTHAALDTLLTRDDIDPKRIGMYGQSLGASIAINVMAQRKEISAAVFESPFTSWRDIAASVLGGQNPGAVSRSIVSLLIPDDHRADEAIARIDRPMLILHGDMDSIISISHGRALAAAAPEYAELVELSDGDHNTLRMSHPEVDRLMIEFFAQHLDSQ